jgi:hypothetical protein
MIAQDTDLILTAVDLYAPCRPMGFVGLGVTGSVHPPTGVIGHVGELVETVQTEVDRYPFAPEGGVLVMASELQGHAGCVGAASLMLAP